MIVLPNVLMLDQAEADAFRAYVKNGGTLYASKYTSLVTPDGEKHSDFLLGDVLGVSYAGETQERFTYIAPAQGQAALFGDATAQYPVGLRGTQIKVNARPGAQVLGTLTLPFTDTAEAVDFASIHSDPPGITTDSPALVINRYGKGQAIYVAGELELSDAYRDLFIRLLRMAAPAFTFEAEAPKVVEITAFHQPEQRRYIACLVNFQQELPNIPVHGITLRLDVGDAPATRVLALPQGAPVSWSTRDEKVVFDVASLQDFAMFAVEY